MQLNLIQTCSWVCDMFDKNPQWNYIRLSNNHQPANFTDQEAVTVYLFVGKYQKYSQIADIHAFAYHYLLDWFPNLTSCQKFNNRLNVIWLIQKVNIQNAAKIRSAKGLWLHCFGKLAIATISFLF